MDTQLLQYISGEDIHAGDRVQYRGVYGNVVFVSHGEQEEFSPGYESYTGSEPGVVVCDDDGETTQIPFADEQLMFIDRT